MTLLQVLVRIRTIVSERAVEGASLLCVTGVLCILYDATIYSPLFKKDENSFANFSGTTTHHPTSDEIGKVFLEWNHQSIIMQ